ncbi:MAG: hypothetical protein ACP5PP_06375, partial [Fervidobacterium sp.]
DDISIVQFRGHNFGTIPGILSEIASRMALHKEALALVHREFFGTDKNNNIYGGASSDENY